MDFQILKDFDLFQDLNDEQLKSIFSVSSRQNFKKGNMILIEEEMGTTLFLIVNGKVKISRISDDGREVILSILSEGDFFGEMAVIDGLHRSANAVTTEETELIMIRREEFMQCLYQHPQLAVNLLKELTSRLRRSDQHIKSLSLQDAVGKVASAFIRLAENSGMYRNGNVVIANIPAQQDLANMAGTSRETISRVIKILSKDGHVNKDGNNIIIHDYDKFKAAFS